MDQVRAPDAARKTDGTWMIAFGAVVASIGAYVFQVLGGRSLGADGFAPVATVWTIGFLLTTIVMLPVEQMTTRTVTLTAGDTLSSHTRRQIAIALTLAGLVGVGIATIGNDRFFEANATFIAAMALLMLSRALMSAGRGVMAGRRRFRAYGISMMLEAVALVALGAVFAIIDAGSLWFAVALGTAPLTFLLVRPFLVRRDPTRSPQDIPSTTRLLQLLVLAAALSQLILAAGPLVVSLIGGTAAEVSIYFITFTLLRGPITASYGLATRFLAAMATAVSDNKPEILHSWATRLAVLGAAASAIAGIASYFILPGLIELLYGAEFRPSALVGGLGGAGAVAALAVVFVTQILIARGRTRDLVLGWLFAAAAATLVLETSGAEPVTRVAYAFVAGEVAAFSAISISAYRNSH